MVDERARRRPCFSPGIPVRLADGQEWCLPAPGDLIGPDAERDDPEYAALCEGVAHAEDEIELACAELALTIGLLDRNYDLGPSDFSELLEAPSGSPRAELVRVALRSVSGSHVPRHEPEWISPAGASGWRGILSWFAEIATGRGAGTRA